MAAGPPSRILLIAAGALTQLVGVACLVLALASLPAVHDQHHGMSATLASGAAAAAACVCGYLVYYGRFIPLGLALVIDVGFGVVLPRGDSIAATLVRILPAESRTTADDAITAGAIVIFATAVLCALAIPSAIKLRRWERAADDDSPDLQPADTLKGFGVPVRPSQGARTSIVRTSPRRRMLVIAGVAITLTAVGVVVISAFDGGDSVASGNRSGSTSTSSGDSSGGGKRKGSASEGSGTKPIVAVAADAGVRDAGTAADAAAPAPSLDDFVAHAQLAALAKLDAKELGVLFAPKAFAFGVEANEIAEGSAAIVKMLRHDIGEPPPAGFQVDARSVVIGREKSLGWVVALVDVNGKQFSMSEVVGLQDGAWRTLALEWAVAVANESAYKQARSGDLPVPDAIPDHHDTSTLAAAMRKAFTSKAAFVASRATRADAVNVGSAPNERIVGGDTIRRAFSRLKATIALRGAVAVGTTDDGGWGAANVDFTDADRDGTQVTQTFRVLAAWVRDGPDWRIVQTHWSNAK